MINLFDRTLKIIARNHAATFLRLAFAKHKVRLLGTIENVEISLSVKPVDFVHRVLYGGKEYLFHLEFQTQHKAILPRRTFIISAELTEQFKLPVLTVFLYLQPREKEIPHMYVTQLGKTVINEFKYPVIKLWDFIDEIRQGKLRELAPLLPMLVTEPNEALLAEERDLILQENDPQKRADLLAAAIAVGSRYFEREFLWTFFQEEVEYMKTATFIDDWITEGIEKGMQQGMQQGLVQGYAKGRDEGVQQGLQQGLLQAKKELLQTARDDVLEVLMIRFGKLPKLLVKRIKSINDLMVLKSLLRQAVTSESLAMFVDFIPDDDELPISLGDNRLTSNWLRFKRSSRLTQRVKKQSFGRNRFF